MIKKTINWIKNFYRRYKTLATSRLSGQEQTDGKTPEYSVAQMNLYRVFSMSILLVVVQIVSFFLDLFLSDSIVLLSYYFIIEGFLLALAVYCIGFLCRILSKNDMSLFKMRVFYITFWLTVEIFYIAIYLLKGYASGELTSPLAIYIILAAIPLFNRKERSVFLTLPGAVWAGAYLMGITTLYIAVYNAIIMTAFSYAGSFILYHSVKNHIQIQKQLQEAYKEMERMSLTDSLTRLLNRRGLEQFVQQLWNCTETTACVVVIDIDFFKDFNDRYGHFSGDECLLKITSVIYETFSPYAAGVSRMGGEEFTAVFQNISAEKVRELTKAMMQSIEKLCVRAGNTSVSPFVTVSAGLTLPKPVQTESFDIMFTKADNALYKAKQEGRNRMVVSE